MLNIKDELLLSVEKPARYTGGEVNMVRKNLEKVKARFAMCFPDVYEVGMSHLGLKILYHVINQREDSYCERAFAPWIDMEKIMREKEIPLYSLEMKEPLKNFDFLGFTLQYEMSYTNILNMLDLSGIPVRAEDRGEEYPLIVCGGPCAYNPEPLALVADFFQLGEGEEMMNDILDIYVKFKEEGKTKLEYLEEISKIQGIYVPAFYDVTYKEDGTIKEMIPKKDIYPKKITKRIMENLDETIYPDKMIVPLTEIVHDRVMLETFRGCTRGCRFCQAGMIYRPVRERKTDTLIELADKLIKGTGYDELSLTSLSICDYSDIKNLVMKLVDKYKDEKVGVSLPSLRIDSFSVDLINEIQKVRKTGLTFAPEAGSQRMRDIINKGVTENDLIESVTSAFELGWSTIKLYFMIGLPFEEMEDIEGIADLALKVVDAYYSVPKEKRKKGRLTVTVSTSSLVPKPFTPFQWEPQNRREELVEKQNFLKSKIRNRNISYNWHDSPVSFLEGVVARGDRRISEVIIRAFELGCRFDGWGECFDYDKWMKAFEDCNVDPHFYANRRRELDEVLPWDFIDIGVTKAYLINELKKAKEATLTQDCRLGCTGCGMTTFLKGGKCFNGATFNQNN
ncbi:TIGR03960 family B12-binding radical SAM protein [Clostridium cylindrosporum]|uniref:Fe-S oxidoreductase n=1 Tax=Clostridium cylindrosporum DSM 605 TaxID=1121307 RepID=A0A0J8DB90_CLOCY|nr:TIGR03960 family B12-binding radical SAM protein [Clostridium cylindrosporum]KMT21548.1 Fe-S oxidoreductase [Clostridium cylindrosporum DSM 605]